MEHSFAYMVLRPVSCVLFGRFAIGVAGIGQQGGTTSSLCSRSRTLASRAPGADRRKSTLSRRAETVDLRCAMILLNCRDLSEVGLLEFTNRYCKLAHLA